MSDNSVKQSKKEELVTSKCINNEVECQSPVSNCSDSISSITSMEEIINNPDETNENGVGIKCPISSWISNIKLY